MDVPKMFSSKAKSFRFSLYGTAQFLSTNERVLRPTTTVTEIYLLAIIIQSDLTTTSLIVSLPQRYNPSSNFVKKWLVDRFAAVSTKMNN